MNIYFYEGDRSRYMQTAGQGTIRAVWRDERGEGNGAGIGEEECDLEKQQ